MKLKLAALAAVALMVAAGGASAMTSALDNQLMMAPFYTDSGMKTMKGDDDFMATVKSMKPADRETIRSECSHDNTMHSDFCGAFMKAMKKM